MLYYAVLCYVKLYKVNLCYIMLCYVNFVSKRMFSYANMHTTITFISSPKITLTLQAKFPRVVK